MAENLGKKWEDKFRLSWKKQFPNTFIYRLPDSQSGFAGTGGSNPCDFLAYTGECLLMVECKAHKQSSINFSAIRQYDKMLDYKGIKNTFPGVLVWFYEKDKVLWVPIEEMEKMVNDGEKSIGLRMLEKDYKKSYFIIELPGKKLRTFIEADYQYLVAKLTEVNNG